MYRPGLLRVRDNGIGIAADQLESIFGLFNQVDSALERLRSGLGLGLTLVRQLVGQHGGRVEARNDGPGRGSEFRGYLPVLADAPTPAPVPVSAAKPPTAGRQILVIDDNRDAATTLSMMLKLLGHQVHTRYDGREGTPAAESLQPGGAAMLLITLTGFGQDEDRRLSREAGFDAHLVKPVDLVALTQLLTTLPATGK